MGELVAPAIRLAEDGFAVDEYARRGHQGRSRATGPLPRSASLYVPGGTPLAVGARLKNPDLARTLRRIAEQGRDGFYKGETADLLVAEMKRGKGIITAKDLEGYEAKWRAPIAFQYRGHDVISMPPPSSGGLTLALIAGSFGPYDLAGLGWHTAKAVHVHGREHAARVRGPQRGARAIRIS